MGRPEKPPIGTVPRLEQDLADCWPIYRFVEDRIKEDPRKPGRILRAHLKAMKKFRCSMTKVKRHYKLIAASIESGAFAQWTASALVAYAPDIKDTAEKIDRAFTPVEQRELGSVGVHLVSEFADLRLNARKQKRNRK